jgi:hypothetical protein
LINAKFGSCFLGADFESAIFGGNFLVTYGSFYKLVDLDKTPEFYFAFAALAFLIAAAIKAALF